MASYVTLTFENLIDNVHFSFDGPGGTQQRFQGIDRFSTSGYGECTMDSINQASCYSTGADIKICFWMPERPIKLNVKAKNDCRVAVYIGVGGAAERVAIRDLKGGTVDEIRIN